MSFVEGDAYFESEEIAFYSTKVYFDYKMITDGHHFVGLM